jgi:SAM-dependent methyltransferase
VCGLSCLGDYQGRPCIGGQDEHSRASAQAADGKNVEKDKIAQLDLRNVQPMLAQGYDCGLPDHVADVACALDMFFGVKQPAGFLAELKRITKPDGILVIDDGHQPREATKEKILASGLWIIQEETPDHLTCRPA